MCSNKSTTTAERPATSACGYTKNYGKCVGRHELLGFLHGYVVALPDVPGIKVVANFSFVLFLSVCCYQCYFTFDFPVLVKVFLFFSYQFQLSYNYFFQFLFHLFIFQLQHQLFKSYFYEALFGKHTLRSLLGTL